MCADKVHSPFSYFYVGGTICSCGKLSGDWVQTKSFVKGSARDEASNVNNAVAGIAASLAVTAIAIGAPCHPPAAA